MNNEHTGENPATSTRRGIFVSYSHKDRKLFEEFKTMLAPAIAAGLVEIWDDTKIETGDLWKGEIEKALASARIAVLLVSQNFLASDFIAKDELPPLLNAAKNNGVKIFWVYLSAALYETTEIAKYQAAHDTANSLDTFRAPERQAEWKRICQKLIKLASNNPEAVPKIVDPPNPFTDERLRPYTVWVDIQRFTSRAFEVLAPQQRWIPVAMLVLALAGGTFYATRQPLPKPDQLTPIDNEVGVAFQPRITVRFDRQVRDDEASLALSEKSTGNSIKTEKLSNDDPKTVNFRVLQRLDCEKGYDLKLIGVKDRATGRSLNEIRWHFTTKNGDCEPPSLKSVSPEDQAKSVALRPKITAVFSEEIKDEKDAPDKLKLVDSAGATISTRSNYDKKEKKLEIQPLDDLACGKRFKVVLEGVEDLEGNKMPKEEWTFSTPKLCPLSFEEMIQKIDESKENLNNLNKLYGDAATDGGQRVDWTGYIPTGGKDTNLLGYVLLPKKDAIQPVNNRANFYWDLKSDFPQDLHEGTRVRFAGTIREFTPAYIRLDDARQLSVSSPPNSNATVTQPRLLPVRSIYASKESDGGQPLLFLIDPLNRLHLQRFGQDLAEPLDGGFRPSQAAPYGQSKSVAMLPFQSGRLMFSIGSDDRVYAMRISKEGQAAEEPWPVEDIRDEMRVPARDTLGKVKAGPNGEPEWKKLPGRITSIAVGTYGGFKPILVAIGEGGLTYYLRFDEAGRPIQAYLPGVANEFGEFLRNRYKQFSASPTGSIKAIALGAYEDGPILFSLSRDDKIYAVRFDKDGLPEKEPRLLVKHSSSGSIKAIAVGNYKDKRSILFSLQSSGTDVNSYDWIGALTFDKAGRSLEENSESVYARHASRIKAIDAGSYEHGPILFFIKATGQVLALRFNAQGDPEQNAWVVDEIPSVEFTQLGKDDKTSLAVGTYGENRPILFTIDNQDRVFAMKFDAAGHRQDNFFPITQSLTKTNPMTER